MTTLRQAAQQALEALEDLQGGCTDSDDGTVDALTVWCPEVITALREALAQDKLRGLENLMEESITALKAALEQPEQKPVAYYHPHKGFYWAKPTHIAAPTVVDVEPLPLYATPLAAQRPWVDLTDEEIETTWSQLWRDINQMKLASDDRPQKETIIFLFAQAIEAKLKERNT